LSHTLAIILAAGKGTRMKSHLPKVLHKVCGKFMVQYVINGIKKAGITQILTVVGHEGDMVRQALDDDGIAYVVQDPQLGTGHAVMQALSCIQENEATLLVACGDTPLIKAETFEKFLNHHRNSGAVCSILSTKPADPSGYGRVVRNSRLSVEKIVEHRDATSEELLINEINTGTYCFDLKNLRKAVNELKPNNSQGEYYLTDTVGYFVDRGLPVEAYVVEDYYETIGINSRIQLADAEKILRRRKILSLMDQGVTVVDPDTTFVDEDVAVGQDTIIEPFTFLRGKTTVGSNCLIGPQSDIKDCVIGDNAYITRSVLVESSVGGNCIIGPFAYLRPGTVLGRKVKVGDFVEVKNATVGDESKIPHLSYVGDAQVGSNVNIGCGTITCNYDGKFKHRTIIKDRAFIGSNTNLVAPVEVGEGAMTGAGSTITKNVPPEDLALGRCRQVNLSGWAGKKRKELDKKESMD